MNKPNVLWIQTDEQRPDSLGCYGSAWAKTPYVDGLARRGIVFQNCVCNSPVCVPSRASQLAARYPQELRTVFNQVYALAGLEAPGAYRGRDLFSEPAPEAVYAQIGWPDLDAPLFQRAFAERVSEVPSTGDLSPTSQRVPTQTQMRGAQTQMRGAIRTARYRMDVTWYENGRRLPREEADGDLFDLQDDPYEMRNLWADPDMQPVVDELWLKLEAWFASLDRPVELFPVRDSSKL